VREAFDLLASRRVQVIVSDQRMADMNGTEFLTRVRDLYPDTIRMVLSGYTDLATITEAINRGAIYRFLTKPWNDDELREHIRDAFRAHEQREDAPDEF
jgi:DNA-binding NtrC family response regulator